MTVNREALEEQRAKVASWGKVVKPRIDAVLDHCGDKVLDIGCSSGAYVRVLRDKGYSAFGCDLLIDQHWHGSSLFSFLAADIVNLPFKDQSFDSCVAFEIIEHVENIDQALCELHRIAKKNIIISVPNCFQEPVFAESGLAYHHWTDPTHRQAFTAESLKAALEKNGFSLAELSYMNPVLPETLLLTAWHFPLSVSRWIGRAASKLPLRRKYCMTLLAVANCE